MYRLVNINTGRIENLSEKDLHDLQKLVTTNPEKYAVGKPIPFWDQYILVHDDIPFNVVEKKPVNDIRHSENSKFAVVIKGMKKRVKSSQNRVHNK